MGYDLKQLHERFFSDPMWPEMEELILEYLTPFRSNITIDTKGKSNDEIATEVKGRNLMIENLEKFLGDTKIIRRQITSDKPNYK